MSTCTDASENIDATAVHSYRPTSVKLESYKDHRRQSNSSTPMCYSESTVHRKLLK